MNGETLAEQKKYDEAVKAYETAGDYKDAADKIKECYYNNASDKMEAKEYAAAKELFLKSEYSDYSDKANECLIKQAEAYLADKKFEDAIKTYGEVDSKYKDCTKKIDSAYTKWGSSLYKSKDYKGAVEKYEQVTKKDVTDKINKAKAAYVKDHKDRSDETTMSYLCDLRYADYGSAEDDYTKLIGWTVESFVNDKLDDYKNKKTSADSSKTIYVHTMYLNENDASMSLKGYVIYSDGTKSNDITFGEVKDRYTTWMSIDPSSAIKGDATLYVYDDTDKFELEPPKTFPGKLTKFLYHRFETFKGDMSKGLVMLPVELIDDNGIMLKKCVMQLIELWGLGDEFKKWVDEACVFTSTLVDRIITGYPRATEKEEWEKLGYEDHIMVTGEPFALWVIESAKDISKEFPLPDAGLPVIFTDNQKPYKQRKVRILNGAHTSFVLASYLCGNDIVRQSMHDDDIRNFMLKTIYDEVIPTLSLPEEELKQFAGEVVNRFDNPYVDHALLAISLNSVSKWRARCMPSLLGYVEKTGKLPAHLTFSIAALMAFYHGTEIRDKALIGHRDGQEYNIMDDKAVLEFFAANCEKDTKTFVTSFLGNEDFFGQDLNKVPGLTDAVVAYLDDIKANGMRAALCKIS